MNPRAFQIDGIPFALVGGRRIPGLPEMRIIRADTGKHVSLSYDDGDGALFDDRQTGYRLNVDGSVTRYATKAEYWKARRKAGWPGRKRKAGPA
jgi:hypothetical protein